MLDKLKVYIDEKNYPYFEDEELKMYLEDYQVKDIEGLKKLAYDLLIIKAGIEEIEICGMKIPSPRKHFINLASRFRPNKTGAEAMVRADGRC